MCTHLFIVGDELKKTKFVTVYEISCIECDSKSMLSIPNKGFENKVSARYHDENNRPNAH